MCVNSRNSLVFCLWVSDSIFSFLFLCQFVIYKLVYSLCVLLFFLCVKLIHPKQCLYLHIWLQGGRGECRGRGFASRSWLQLAGSHRIKERIHRSRLACRSEASRIKRWTRHRKRRASPSLFERRRRTWPSAPSRLSDTNHKRTRSIHNFQKIKFPSVWLVVPLEYCNVKFYFNSFLFMFSLEWSIKARIFLNE